MVGAMVLWVEEILEISKMFYKLMLVYGMVYTMLKNRLLAQVLVVQYILLQK